MRFGIYIHIPYCEHRCSYCDFTTFASHSVMPISDYVDLLVKEIQIRSYQLPKKKLDSLYLGGGTPSLLSPENILTLINTLANAGIEISLDTEFTIEMNPSSAEEKKINSFLDLGINRFSVGAQSFHKPHLETCERIHTVDETLMTLQHLKDRGVNYSLDILYGLPHQNTDQILNDLSIAQQFNPYHISSYLLTIPDSHKLNHNRPTDEKQIEMMDIVTYQLKEYGYDQYEISNYAKTSFESQHNLLYWNDHSYWGLGISAHSYFNNISETHPNHKYGVRFWNPYTFKSYTDSLETNFNPQFRPFDHLKEPQKEILSHNESLTDYCHMHLRLNKGLNIKNLEKKYPQSSLTVEKKLQKLQKKGWVHTSKNNWTLTRQGRHLLNQVLQGLTF